MDWVEWLGEGSDDECTDFSNGGPNGDGTYEIDDPSYDDPPVHMNCRCALAPYFPDTTN
jgi:hypothetical protein